MSHSSDPASQTKRLFPPLSGNVQMPGSQAVQSQSAQPGTIQPTKPMPQPTAQISAPKATAGDLYSVLLD